MMSRQYQAVAAMLALVFVSAAMAQTTPEASATASLKALLEGNRRFVAGAAMHPNESAARRAEVASGQHPFAIVVGCADSRVSPEVVFDRGLGDLFVVRVAGNVLGDPALGSIEYGVEHLSIPLVVVLGHSKCGAVTAALAGGHAEGHVESLVKAIRPAVEQVKGRPGDTLTNAIRANVERVVATLRALPPVLAPRVTSGRLQIVGAVYDVDSGVVEILTPIGPPGVSMPPAAASAAPEPH